MQSLEEMRKELDVIDDQITTLYERRMKVCEGVAEYKIKNGRKVFDKTRENEKLAAVAEKVSTDFNKKGIRELFEQLMSMSRKLQYQRLSEEGVLGRLPFIGLDQLDLAGARVIPGSGRSQQSGSYVKIFWEKCEKLPCTVIP